MNQILLTLGFGLVTAAILSLSAVAFTLEYAVTNVANLSHGEILTIGAYAAYLVHRSTGNAFLAALGAAAAGGVVAVAMHITVIVQRTELIAWYERRGYRRTGERKPFPYGDERFGLPRRNDLAFEVLRKSLSQ